MAFPDLLKQSQTLSTALGSSAIRLLDAEITIPASCPPPSPSQLSCKEKPAPELPTLQVSCLVSGVGAIPARHTASSMAPSESRKLQPCLEPVLKIPPSQTAPGLENQGLGKLPGVVEKHLPAAGQGVLLVPTSVQSGHQQVSDWPHIQDSLMFPPASRVWKNSRVWI